MKQHITKCDDAGDAAKTWCAGEKVKEVTSKLAQETAEGNEGGVLQLPGKQKKQSVFGIVQAKPFTNKEQIEYEHNVLKLTVALNAAWRGVDIPFVRWFFNKYVPSGHLPHRQQLSSRILNEEVDTIMEDIKTEVHGLYGTGSVDGWSTKKDAVQTTGLNVFGKVSLTSRRVRIMYIMLLSRNILSICTSQLRSARHRQIYYSTSSRTSRS